MARFRSAPFAPLALLLAGAAGCHAPAAAPTADPAAIDVVLADGAEVGGALRARNVLVPAGAVVHVVDDLRIEATRGIRIEGELRVRDVALDDARIDAPDVTLVAGRMLTILGAVRGGRGRTYAGLDPIEHVERPGGDGSDAVLVAQSLHLAGEVRAGSGGDAGGAGHAGRGGQIFGVGSSELDEHRIPHDFAPLGPVGYFGGNGGRGGAGLALTPAGGDSGSGGGVYFFPHPSGIRAELEASALAAGSDRR